MKAKFVNEAIKHLTPKSKKELEKVKEEEKQSLQRLINVFKNNKIKVEHEPTQSEGELEITYSIGDIEEFMYAHVYDEEWGEVDRKKVEKLLVTLQHLIDMLVKTENIEIISQIQKVLDDRTLADDLFGAETYNGWDYEDFNDEQDEILTVSEKILMIALYCIAKCKVFLDYTK